MRPAPYYRLPVVRRLLVRGLRFWILARCLLVAVVLMSAPIGPRGAQSLPIRLSPETAGVAVLLSAALGAFELIARRERILVANLGLSAPHVASLLLVPPAVGECVVALVTAM